MTKRQIITPRPSLRPEIWEELERQAAKVGRSAANLAALYITEKVKENSDGRLQND